MQYINFNVQHQVITRTDEFVVVANSKSYLGARFLFSEEWEEHEKTAVFTNNSGKSISVLIEDGECMVPWEMLVGTEFWVGVFAGDRITTDSARVPVRTSTRVNASPGVQPTPGAYELLVAKVEDALSKGPKIGDNENWWVWDATAGDFVDTGVYSHGSSPRIGDNGNWWIGNDDTGVRAAAVDGKDGKDGVNGKDGNSIQSIVRTAGTGAPGTTDTYTVTLTDGSTTTFNVYNGADGHGAGDMTTNVYDPQGKATDIFKAIEDAVKGIGAGPHADTHAAGGSDPITPEMIGAAKVATEIPSGVDLNDYKTPGEYYKSGGAETLANYPSAYGSFALKVERTGAYSVGVTQTLKDHQGNIYTRAHAANSSSDWTAWEELGKAGDFLPIVGGTIHGSLSVNHGSGTLLSWLVDTETATAIEAYRGNNVGRFHVVVYDNNADAYLSFSDGVTWTTHKLYHDGNLPVEAATAEIVE